MKKPSAGRPARVGVDAGVRGDSDCVDLRPPLDPFHKTLVDSMNCGIVARDLGGTISFVNDRLASWMGRAGAELEGEPMTVLGPADAAASIGAEIEATNRGDLRARLGVIRRRDSTTFPALLIPQHLRDALGRIVGCFSIVVDWGTVQTAKLAPTASPDTMRAQLARISMELQNLSFATQIGASPSSSVGHDSLSALSRREAEVLTRLVAGDRVSAIATSLHVSPHTVRNHLKSIFRKLDVRNQSELIQHVRSLYEAPVRSVE